MEKKLYYKGLDENLCAHNGFQYEIGKAYTAKTDDSWHWLHFAKKVTDVIFYGSRVVEVEPLTQVQKYGSYSDMNAKTIRIVRELPHEEIVAKLVDEKCPFYEMKDIKPTYDELLRYKSHIRRYDHYSICFDFDWLTAEQKLSLLPKSWAREVRAVEFTRRSMM